MDTDNDLIESIKQNQQDFILLYDRYYKRILNYIYRMSSDIDLAQDITAQTFLIVLNSLEKFKPKRDNSFAAWIYKIARNEFFKSQSHSHRVTLSMSSELLQYYSHSPAEEIERFEQEYDQALIYKEVLNELNKLSPESKQVIQLKLMEGLTFKEISIITNTNENTLKSLYKRGIEQLQSLTTKFNLSKI